MKLATWLAKTKEPYLWNCHKYFMEYRGYKIKLIKPLLYVNMKLGTF